MTKIRDLYYQTFGRATVIEYIGLEKHKAKWKCRCSCGKEFITYGIYLTTGQTQSCGCLLKEKEHKNGKISGKNNLLEYIKTVRKPPGESSRNHLFYLYKYKANRRGLDFSLSLDEFSILTKGNCFYCGSEPTQIKLQKGVNPYIYNGIDRLDNSRGYVIENCVPCCKTCNSAKSDMPLDDFYFLA